VTSGDEDGVVLGLPKGNKGDEVVRTDEGERGEQKRGGRVA
jgi:hypothetical protein